MSAKRSSPVLWAFPRAETPTDATAALSENGEIADLTPEAETPLGYRHDLQTGDAPPPRRFAERLLANSLRVEAGALGAP